MIKIKSIEEFLSENYGITESSIKKGDVFKNKNGVTVKVIQIKKDPAYTDTMIRLEHMEGLNVGKKTWHKQSDIPDFYPIKVN